MALNKTELIAGIDGMLTDLYNSPQKNPAESRTEFAEKLATLIEAYVKSGTVISEVVVGGNVGTGVGHIE